MSADTAPAWRAPADERFEAARGVADATLYEGYVLYPYRASAVKNQVRWQFGVLVPPSVADADESERCWSRTECLVKPDMAGAAAVSIRIRFLQVQHREVWASGGDGFTRVGRLEAGGQVYVDWDEGVDRVVDLPALPLFPVDGFGLEHEFELPGGKDTQIVSDAGGVAGRVVRRREPLHGSVTVTAEWAQAGDPSELAVKLAVTVRNISTWAPRGTTGSSRDEVVRRSMVALHTMISCDGAVFVSLIDPPAALVEAARSCNNVGVFPVLIGLDDLILSSPIILYDHPEVAPESPGDLYDATEIDEILALRILTLTDEEKAEARATDGRAAAIVDRCDTMPEEMWSRLHGAIRSIAPATSQAVSDGTAAPASAATAEQPWWDPGSDSEVDPTTDSVVVRGVEVARGTRVVLRPSHRADVHDLFLAGLDATVTGVFRDFDGECHIAVSVDDDPATVELGWQGRYLYFHPDEIEPRPTGEAQP